MKEDTIKLVKKAIKGNMDAVQECVTRGLLGIEKLKEPQYFKTWITRILINCIRQDQKKAPTISLDEYVEKGTENYLIEEKVDLYDAIDSLNNQYKTVVILFYFQELKIREISQILDIPEGSVKASLYRAKKQLRKWLTEGIHEKEEKRYAK